MAAAPGAVKTLPPSCALPLASWPYPYPAAVLTPALVHLQLLPSPRSAAPSVPPSSPSASLSCERRACRRHSRGA